MDFSVDPGSLLHAGHTVAATGDRAADLARRHRDSASAGSAAWGRGVPGALHQELVAATGEALDLLAAVLDRGGTGLARMGETYTATDDDAGESFSRLTVGPP